MSGHVCCNLVTERKLRKEKSYRGEDKDSLMRNASTFIISASITF